MTEQDPGVGPVPEPSSVAALLASVARTVSDHHPDEVWVQGIITSWRPYRWHTFMELSDHPSGRLSVVMHRRSAEVITGATGLAAGESPVSAKVAVVGRLTLGTRGILELRAVAARPLVTPVVEGVMGPVGEVETAPSLHRTSRSSG